MEFIRNMRTKLQVHLNNRAWDHSERKKEIDAERDLPPRPLRPEEIEFLRWILEHGSIQAKSYMPQLEGIRAVRRCTCGCPTIQLKVAEDSPLGIDSGEAKICDLQGKTAKNQLVGIILFQLHGQLDDLEFYLIDDIDSHEFDLPLIDTLKEYGA
jgi:hypothetical protein